jgi:DNA-binding NarL/FixJ family response regulator
MVHARVSGRNPRAIICLEGSPGLWKLVKGCLQGEEAIEFIIARFSDAPTDLIVLCRRLAPALVVVEDNGIQSFPFEQLRDLISRREIQILVFSDKLDEVSCEDFFRMGCTGVVPNDVTAGMLRKAVLAICDGELWLPRKILSKLAHDAFLKGAARKVTQRESEIFKLVCLGLTNQHIAEHLFISRETVRWHLRNLYSKIGVDGRPGAIRYAEYGSNEEGAALDAPSRDPANT